VGKAVDQVRIGVELVDASNGTEEWTARYDWPLKDIFAVQDEIVGKVVTTLGLLLKVDENETPHPGSAQPTERLEAFDDLLHAAEYIFSATDNGKAQQWLEKAIDSGPEVCRGICVTGMAPYVRCVGPMESESARGPEGRFRIGAERVGVGSY
jgi:hypothetical protein